MSSKGQGKQKQKMTPKNRCLWITTIVTAIIAVGAVIATAAVIGFADAQTSTERSFVVDDQTNVFLKDGKPFQYVSGSFHYFRALPQVWSERLKTMRAAGLNVIDTYVEWATHNPRDGIYDWSDMADVEKFIQLCADEGFLVILRPGPYICAERDNGGLPHWLFTKYPNIKVRTNDENYKKEVSIWYEMLMGKMKPFLYGNGGPIIMVQVENEYGVFGACDKYYTAWLRDETQKYTQGDALLFTVDIPNERMGCGKIDNVFATTDFGIDRIHEIDEIWRLLREQQPTGPLVNSEFYPGWLTHWEEANQRRDPNVVADSLDKILQYGASVNFYMFFGGTNFGFTAGANNWGYGKYQSDITSYDYDAVMDEAGGTTQKFDLIKEVIKKYPNISNFEEIDESAAKPSTAVSFGYVDCTPIARLLSEAGREELIEGTSIKNERPMSFEELDLFSGFVLYETDLPVLEVDPTELTINGLRDRAYVFVNEMYVGTLSRGRSIYSLPLSKGWGNRLQVLVENQGRINFDIANDTKGIFGEVTIQKYSGELQELKQWTSSAIPLIGSHVDNLVTQYKNGQLKETFTAEGLSENLRHGPVVYHAEFTVNEPNDTHLNMEGWGKGVAYINGFNLGRYWPLVGPQITLYVPKDLLKIGSNTLTLVEYQRVRKNNNGQPQVSFDATPQLDATNT